jgi:hypothetical protein
MTRDLGLLLNARIAAPTIQKQLVFYYGMKTSRLQQENNVKHIMPRTFCEKNLAHFLVTLLS